VQDDFYLMAYRLPFGQFSFESALIDKNIFPSLNFKPDINEISNAQCLIAKINTRSRQLDVFINECSEQHTIICRKILFVKPNCFSAVKFTHKNSFDLLLDPKLKVDYKLAIAYKKAEMMDMFQRLDQTDAYQSFFSTLWYAYIPCFDIRNITSKQNNGNSLLLYCEWKGIPIACSAIFSTVPTDKGMCCSFNMKAADEIYIESSFRNLLLFMQNSDKLGSYIPATVPSFYLKKGEPKAIQGEHKGLVLLLDTHSKGIVPGSFDADFHGFTTVIAPSGSFPLLSQEGISIRPGYNNIITIKSSKINAHDNMRRLHKNDRKCLFSEEGTDLKIYKNYSYLNCKFECIISFVQEEIYKKHQSFCQPWFLPTSTESINVCDPWQSFDFFHIMANKIPDNLCSHCLPECGLSIYKTKVIVRPFDNCDARNLGVSRFCQFSSKRPTPMQKKMFGQIANEFMNKNDGFLDNAPEYVSSLDSNIQSRGFNVFKKVSIDYDAFNEDIAMVHIINQKGTSILMGSQVSMTWIDYFSYIGGILGLVLGMGFVSFIELVWVCLRTTYFHFFNVLNAES